MFRPSLEDLLRVRAEPPAAHVGDVAGAGEEGDAGALPEHGRHHGEIVEMAGAVPGVVGEQHIPRGQFGERVFLQELAHRRRHGVDVPGGPGDRLGEHCTARVEYARREVAGLPYYRGEGGAHQRLRLFLHDGQQPVPDQLDADRIKPCMVNSHGTNI